MQSKKKKIYLKIAKVVWTAMILVLLFSIPVYATSDTNSGVEIVNTGFDVLYAIIAAIVSAVGALFLLWGIFEWAQSLNTADGGAQSMAFKRIASGLVALIVPQLVPVIRAAISQ